MADVGDGRRLSVVMVSPPVSAHGGVAVFVETVKKYLKACDVMPLPVGRGTGEGSITSAARFFTTLGKLCCCLFRKQADVVHLNPSFNFRSLARDMFVLLLLRALRFRKAMVWFHGWDWSVERYIRSRKWHSRFFVWLLNGAGRIVVLAPEFQQSLVEMGVEAGRITVGSTLFDSAALLPRREANDRRTILFMSRFDRRKGMYELLDAYAKIASDFPDVDLAMAGDGPEYARMQQHIGSLKLGERVKLYAYTTGNDKAELLAGCAIFALPTTYPEGMPVVLLEAMGVGVPVLTAKVGGIPHVVHDPDNGVVLGTVTTETVETGLRRLLNDREYCRQVGLRNAEYARKTYDAEIVTVRIEQWYHDIAHGRI